MILSKRMFSLAFSSSLRNHQRQHHQRQQQHTVLHRCLFSHRSYSLLSSPSLPPSPSRFLIRRNINNHSISPSSLFPTTTSTTTTSTMIKMMRMSTEIGKGSINHATAADVTADTCSIGKLKENPNRKNPEPNDNISDRSKSKYSKYLQSWSLNKLISINDILVEDNPNNDIRYAGLIYDFMKRIEINSDRLTDLQQKVESFHSKLRNIQSNNMNTMNDNNDNNDIQDMMHILEDERKTLRNLQRLHYDTWDSVSYQYKLWVNDSSDDSNSNDGNDEDDNDEDSKSQPLMTDPKQRVMRWNALVDAATEIQARHSLTIEQMSELVIKLKPLYNSNSNNNSNNNKFNDFGHDFDDEIEIIELQLNDLYDTVCSFMRCRMTQQLLCQHLIAMGKDALGTNIVTNKLKEQQEQSEQQVENVEKDREENVEKDKESTTQSAQPISNRIVGAVNVNTSIVSLVRSSITEASQLCEATYLISPPVTFVVSIKEETQKGLGLGLGLGLGGLGGKESESESITSTDNGNGNDGNEIHAYENVSGTFVRAWLQYTLIELFKNAMAATVENNPNIVNRVTGNDDNDDHDDDHAANESKNKQQQLPSLYVHIYEDKTISDNGDGNVVIKLFDQGGGIKKGSDDFDLESLFRFAQRKTVWDRMDEQQTYAQMRSPLKGLGVGLSLSRWHMRHFGGDLTLENRGGNNPQHENKTIRVRGDSPGGRRSKWYTLDKGMTATIRIPKNDNIPVVIS